MQEFRPIIIGLGVMAALFAVAMVFIWQAMNRDTKSILSDNTAARGQATGAKIEMTSAAQFDAEVLKSDMPVLVDFWASWCGPCKMLAPIIDEFAADNKGRVKVVGVDVDQLRELTERYSVDVYPTMLVFYKGKLVERRVGYCKRAEIDAMVSKAR